MDEKKQNGGQVGGRPYDMQACMQVYIVQQQTLIT